MNWIDQIDQTTKAFQLHFDSLSGEELNWKPNEGTWSIGQIIDHIIVINQSYFHILTALRDGSYKTPFTAKIGFLVSFFGKTVFNASKPDRKKKIKTFPIWEPSTSQIPVDILSKFVDHQSRLKEEINASDDLVLKGAVISSPVNKHIVYTLKSAFDIIVVHEQRHLEQAKEVQRILQEKVPSSK